MRVIFAAGLSGTEKKKTVFAIAKDIAAKGSNVAVVLTEADDANIKSDIVDVPGIHAREMISSCVPCSFEFDLINEIEKIREIPDIEFIIIELPFSAIPNDIKEALESMKYEDVIFAPLLYVIDAKQMESSIDKIPKLIKTQITNSQILSINTDDVSEEKISPLHNTLKEMNSSANIIEFSMNSKGQEFENLTTSLNN